MFELRTVEIHMELFRVKVQEAGLSWAGPGRVRQAIKRAVMSSAITGVKRGG